jgi:hypothetical protein
VQESLPPGKAQLNAVMYFDGIQQDSAGYQSVDGGIVLGAFFRKAVREQNDAMRSICSFVEVGVLCQRVQCADPVVSRGECVVRWAFVEQHFCIWDVPASVVLLLDPKRTPQNTEACTHVLVHVSPSSRFWGVWPLTNINDHTSFTCLVLEVKEPHR